MRINILSNDGERQLIVDIVYIRKLIGQFLNTNSNNDLFETLDTILLATLTSKKEAEIRPHEELLEDNKIRDAL